MPRVVLDGSTERLDARAIVDRAVTRKGGRDALLAVRTVQTSATSDADGPMAISLAFPDRVAVRYVSQDSALEAIVFDGTEAKIKQAGRVRTASGAQRVQLEAALAADSIAVLVAASQADTTITYAGGADVDGEQGDAIDVQLPNLRVRMFIERSTHDLRAIEYELHGERVLSVFSDFRPVGELRIAHTTRVIGKAMDRTTTVQQVVLNPDLAPETFQLPSEPGPG